MSKTILCVDDSTTMQTVCEITFRASEFQYMGARTVEEGLQKARATRPSLVLADAAMPGKSGYELCRELKADSALAGVPVVLMCGNSCAYDAAKGSAAGVDGHVTKPWDSGEVLEQVMGFINAGATAAAPARTAGASAPTMVPTPAPMPRPAATPAPVPMAAASAPPSGASSARPMSVPTPVAARPMGQRAGTADGLPKPPPGLNRPPMIRGVPTRRPAAAVPPGRGPAIPRSPTLMGVQSLQAPGGRSTAKPPGVTSISARRPAQVAPAPAPVPARQPPPRMTAPGPAMAEVSARVEAAVPAAARAAAQAAGLDPNGPEMSALVRLSREVIERVVWEVVPELAETIIRENLHKFATK